MFALFIVVVFEHHLFICRKICTKCHVMPKNTLTILYFYYVEMLLVGMKIYSSLYAHFLHIEINESSYGNTSFSLKPHVSCLIWKYNNNILSSRLGSIHVLRLYAIYVVGRNTLHDEKMKKYSTRDYYKKADDKNDTK